MATASFTESCFSLSNLAQGLPLHVGHHVEQESVGLPGVMQREDMGMLKIGRDLDLAEEALGTQDGGQFGLQDLHRHLAVVLQVLGQIDRSHPPATDLPLDLIAVSECGLQAFLVLHVG